MKVLVVEGGCWLVYVFGVNCEDGGGYILLLEICIFWFRFGRVIMMCCVLFEEVVEVCECENKVVKCEGV